MKLIDIQNLIIEKNIKVFTALEFARIMGLSNIASQKLLERYTRRNIFSRLKNGLYATRPNPPPSFLIANKIYRPSYISFETALSYYGIIPEFVYTITSATTKTTREFLADGKTFIFHKIKTRAFTGYKPVKIRDDLILIALPEKALADYLYFVHLKKKVLSERLDIKKIDSRRIIKYIKLFGRPKFLNWVKNDILRGN